MTKLDYNPFIVGSERWVFFNQYFGKSTHELEIELKSLNDEIKMVGFSSSFDRKAEAIKAVLKVYDEINTGTNYG